MSQKYNALRNLLEQTPKSLPAIKKLESWGSCVDLDDNKLLELAILLPRADVSESLNRLKNAIKFADGLPTSSAPVLSIQETIQAIIDRDPVNAPELLRAAALGRND